MKRMKQQSKQKQEVLCEHFLYLETNVCKKKFDASSFSVFRTFE